MVSQQYSTMIATNMLILKTQTVHISKISLDIEHRKNRFNPYTLNYGTVVGVAGADFVVVAGDTRLSEGYSIVTRN